MLDINEKVGTSGYDIQSEMLVELLSSCMKIGDAERSAQALMKKYGKLHTVLSCTEEELCETGGLGMNQALLLKIAAYVNSRRVTDRPDLNIMYDDLEMLTYLQAIFVGLSVETVYLLLFDRQNRLIGHECVGEGSVVGSDIYPRRLVECAMRRKAKGVVLLHNHPKGVCTPSMEDMDTTVRLKHIFAASGIDLLGHYIVADGKYSKIDV